MSVPLATLEAARAAALPAWAVSGTAAITAGVETALAADCRCWGRRLLGRLDELPITATSQREFVAALAEEFSAAADEIDHGAGRIERPTLRPERHPQPGSGAERRGPTPTFDGPRGPRCR